jgi:predicted nucleic acid-binding protein
MVKVFRERAGDEIIAFSRFTQLELLQGAKNEQEWQRLDTYLSTQYYLEATENTWRDAARIYFELRKNGITINSPIDCCIAQLAIETQVLLLHRDKDFERIARIRPLAAERSKLR